MTVEQTEQTDRSSTVESFLQLCDEFLVFVSVSLQLLNTASQ